MALDGFYKYNFLYTFSDWADKPEERKVDMALIEVVAQFHNGWNIIPTIIAKTLQTLTLCKHQGKGFFTALAYYKFG